MRTIDWVVSERAPTGAVVIIDQTVLPHTLSFLELTEVDELVDAVRRLAVRGAPALGAAGGLGVLLAVRRARRHGWDDGTLAAAVARVRDARPTATNLAWGVDRVAARIPEGDAAVEAEALGLLDAEVAASYAMGERGADLLVELCGPLRATGTGAGGPGGRAAGDDATGGAGSGGLRVLTHCNAGALACIEHGSALGVVRSLHGRGGVARVYADETRPLLQGARLTAWELDRMGADYRVVVDGAGPSLIARGLVDVVVVGADRVAANGDVANKVGTYPLALAAARAGVPVVVAAPESTVDPDTPDGDAIVIEDRPEDEVLGWAGVRTAPAGARAVNPAFDVTPADLVTALVTERRVVRPAAGEKVAT